MKVLDSGAGWILSNEDGGLLLRVRGSGKVPYTLRKAVTILRAVGYRGYLFGEVYQSSFIFDKGLQDCWCLEFTFKKMYTLS